MHVNKKRKVVMDANSVISAFLVSSNQYTIYQNENNLMQLQRHLEIIDCLTTTSSDLEIFQSRNPVSSQCITHIVNLLLDTNVKCTLIPRALSILQNLSKSRQLNKSLQSVFHVHSAVSVFLQKYGSDFKDILVLQCLDILENVTYDIKIDYLASHLECLINVLLKLIDNESPQLLKSTMRILCNLIRHNVKVQNYIWSLPSAKSHIKRIVVMLNKEEPQILVYALIILANLTSNFPIAAELWTDNHLMVAFRLIIKLLFGSNESCAISALDLFLDIISLPKLKSYFIKSPYLNSLLKRIPKTLNENVINHPSIYLQILNALVQIPECQRNVCSILYESQPASGDSNSKDIKIHPKLINWCQSKNISDTTTILSLKLLKSIIYLHINDNFKNIENSIKVIIKSILENFSIPVLSETELENNLEAHIAIFEILILLLKKTDLKSFVVAHANIGICEKIAFLLLNVYKTDESENVSCINLFLIILEVVLLIESSAFHLEKISSKILNDQTAMQYLAFALTCNNYDSVKQAILIVSLTKCEFSIDILSNNIILRTSNLQKRLDSNSELHDSSFSSNANQQGNKVQNMSIAAEKQIDTLLAKIEKGLSIKDFKQSEIMDLYEHKIAVLTRQIQELQGYIEVKTAALQKADQMMTQYKCRQADSDVEAVQLRTMIKVFESRCERAVVKYEEAAQKWKTQKEELDQALSKVKELQQYEKEQNELMQTQMNRQFEQKKIFEEEKAKLLEMLNSKDCEKKTLGNHIKELEEEIKSKCKAIEAIEESRDESQKKVEECKNAMDKLKLNFEQKQTNLQSLLDSAQQTINSLHQKNENLIKECNQKVEDYCQQVSKLEGEKDTMKEQLKLKESKIADLSETVKSVNSQLSRTSCNLSETEMLNEKLKVQLEETQTKTEKLENDIKMLELLCKRYETSLEKKDREIKSLVDKLEKNIRESEKRVEEKDKQVKDMEAEIEKYKYITGMINQMTSGKIPPKQEK